MNKTVATLLTICLAVTVGAIGAYAFQQLIIQNHGTISVVGAIDIYVDDELNPTSIDWGTMEPDAIYYVNLTVASKYNANATVTLTVSGSPPGTHTWSLNGTIWQAYETRWADLELAIPSDAVAGAYAWNMTITATEI